MATLKAVEFFSGIGAFSYGARHRKIEVVKAFDQYEAANDTFEFNFGLRPTSQNLDSVTASDIPQAEIWWMSPPCTPYSVRGNQLDVEDARAKSFLNLINFIPKLLPEVILIENVTAFAQSQAYQQFLSISQDCGYQTITLAQFCPTMAGIPMRRPRCFVISRREKKIQLAPPPHGRPQRIREFLQEPHPELFLDRETVTKYGAGFDIVDADGSDILICFTKGYARCMKASGSILRSADGQLRRFSPSEILHLLGFGDDFRFPPHLGLDTQWRLVGNSVDVRAIEYFLYYATR